MKLIKNKIKLTSIERLIKIKLLLFDSLSFEMQCESEIMKKSDYNIVYEVKNGF